MNKDTSSKAADHGGQPLEWHDGDMPYSTAFGDHFYCREDGRAECAYVFLDGNGLPERWAGGGEFVVGLARIARLPFEIEPLLGQRDRDLADEGREGETVENHVGPFCGGNTLSLVLHVAALRPPV